LVDDGSRLRLRKFSPTNKIPVSQQDHSTNPTTTSQVTPDSYQTPDIICHKSGKPGKAHIPVVAGQTVQLFWNTWPPGHSGPVIDYLAACANNDCSTVDKTALKFAKIDQVGLHNGPAPGNWAVNDLVSNNNSWVVTVPASLKAGAYVLRHEIVSLHAARSDNGAQNYPQCVNLSKCMMAMSRSTF
jgi:cellulase